MLRTREHPGASRTTALHSLSRDTAAHRGVCRRLRDRHRRVARRRPGDRPDPGEDRVRVAVDYLHDRRAAESTVELLLAEKGAAVAVRADVTDELDVERLFGETSEVFGGIDVVVHAVSGSVLHARVAEGEAARRLRHGGAIINLTSSAAGSPCPGYGALAATKAAVEALTRVLALELCARDITVNAVALQLDGPCTPGRADAAIAYLLSGDGRSSTGRVIRTDVPEADEYTTSATS